MPEEALKDTMVVFKPYTNAARGAVTLPTARRNRVDPALRGAAG